MQRERGLLKLSFFQEIKQKIEKSMEQASQRSQNMYEMSKLNYKIKAKKGEIEEVMNQLGWAIYRTWESNQTLTINAEVQRVLQSAHTLLGQLQEMEEKREALKNASVMGTSLSQKASHHQPQPALQASTTLLYICPFCAHQVHEQDSRCSYCQQQFY